MIRPLAACLLAVLLAACTTLAADDPKPDDPDPVLIKKKKKTDLTKDEKPKPKDGDPKDEPPAEVDEKEVLERINKNIEAAKKRLEKKDVGDGTQQAQKDIAKDLGALLEQAKKQQQNQQQADNNSSPNSGQSKNTQTSKRPRRDSSTKSGTKTNPETQAKESKTNGGGLGRMGEDGPSKMADLYKDIWGHLPETLRLEMDAYARDKFMVKYNDLLKQYYSTIAEKGRRSENDK